MSHTSGISSIQGKNYKVIKDYKYKVVCEHLFPGSLGEPLAAATCFIGALNEKNNQMLQAHTTIKIGNSKLPGGKVELSMFINMSYQTTRTKYLLNINESNNLNTFSLVQSLNP